MTESHPSGRLIDMYDIKRLIEEKTAEWWKERSQTQLTLGGMIGILETMDPSAPVPNLVDPHSYRGYYSDLAFERHPGSRTAGELLADCRNALGSVFVGYKGGDFYMVRDTPVWVASYGSCGLKILKIGPGNELETKEDEYHA